jgi:tRNA A-37 threonylcarbamoyl transferase component Bud32
VNREVESLIPASFELLREGASWLALRRGVGEELRRLVLAAPAERGGDAAFEGRGMTQRVAFDGPEPGRAVFRRYRRGGLFRWLTRDKLLGGLRPFRELRAVEAARGAGVPTAEVLAVRVDRVGPGVYRGEMVTRELVDAPDLVTWLCGADAPRGRERSAAIDAIGRAVRRMHDAGIVHADLHVKNILLRREPSMRVFVIDFDRATIEDRLPRDVRDANLRRLDRSTVKFNLCARPAISRADRVRFLRGYVSAGPGGDDALGGWVSRGRSAGYPWRVLKWRLSGQTRKGA